MCASRVTIAHVNSTSIGYLNILTCLRAKTYEHFAFEDILCQKSGKVYLKITVAAASLLIASRVGASPQKFEKRALTIFRLEPDPYESAHQLDCSFLSPTATANGTGR